MQNWIGQLLNHSIELIPYNVTPSHQKRQGFDVAWKTKKNEISMCYTCRVTTELNMRYLPMQNVTELIVGNFI